MKYVLTTVGFLTFAGGLLCGCKTAYPEKQNKPPTIWAVRSGRTQVDSMAAKPGDDDSQARSANYRYSAELPKEDLDRIMVAVEEYHQQLMAARFGERSKWPVLMGYTSVVIHKDANSFRKGVTPAPDMVVDSDHVAVIPSKRKLVILYRRDWKEFSRCLFRAQARLFFTDFMPQLPLWLHEGMVSFFEEVAAGGLGAETTFKIVGYNTEKMAGVQKLIKSGNFPGFASIISATKREELGEAGRLTAWAFVYWSQHSGRRSTETFKRYLAAILEKGAENVELTEYFHMSLAAFEKRWKEWLLRQEVYLGKATQERGGGKRE